MTTADTLTISFPGISAEGYECQWELGSDAIVISEAPGHIQLAYATPGSRDISLAVTDGQGRTSATTMKTVTVYPVDMEERDFGTSSITGICADWNSDGFMDCVGEDGFYQNDGTGLLAKATGSFNMNLTFNTSSYCWEGIMDYNMDGLPDLFASSNKGDTFLNTSADGRMLFDARGSGSGLLGKNSISNVLWADLDNDGDLDVYYDYYNNVTYEEIVCNDGHLTFGDADIFRQWRTGYSVLAFYGVDSDGWIDILGYERDNYGENWVFVVDKNKGNWVFERVATSLHEDDHRLMDAFATMADMDGDGYADAVCLETDRRVRIYYGDAGMTYARTSEVLLPIECDGISLLHDVDNDGTIDIVLTPYYRGISPYTQVVAYNSLAGSFSCQIMDDDVSEAHAYPVDLDGDGVPDWVQAKALGWWRYAKVNTRITNTAPQTPTNLRMRQTEEGVVLEWDAATDKETPKNQMRYNVSVRGKGLTGRGAYYLSPMNGGSDEAAIVPGHHYVKGTRFTMPLSVFQPGMTCKLQVQAIDLWNATSATSEPFEFMVDESAGIVFSVDEACVGESVTARYMATGTSGGVPTWRADDGEVTVNEDGTASILWTKGGVKTVTAVLNGWAQASFYVKEDTVDFSIDVPGMVLGGCPVEVSLPQVFADDPDNVWIDCEEAPVKVERRGNTLDARITFPEEVGTYTLTVHYNGVCGERSQMHRVQVVGSNITPVISIVGVDEATGKAKVQWEVPANVSEQDGLFDGIIIYKESGRTNNFVKLDEVPLTATSYVDVTSDPSVRKSRYRIALSTTYGGESQPSDVHSNVHVMLNKGLDGAVNIVWTPYEGAVIDQYTIWRGTEASGMEVLATASGYEMSYTDFVPEGSEYDYAVSYENTYETEWIDISVGTRRASRSGRTVNVASARSNTVSTRLAVEAVFAEKLSIMALEDKVELSASQPVLHLYAEVLPANATFKQVAWSIVEGNDLATIASTGELMRTGNGSGTVVVQAATVDGSGLVQTLSVPVLGSCTVTLHVNNPDWGYVEGAGTYDSGTEVVVSAHPYAGGRFVQWSDGNAEAVRTLRLSADVELTAEFEADPVGIGNASLSGIHAWVQGGDLVVDGLPEDKDVRLCVMGSDGRVWLEQQSEMAGRVRIGINRLAQGFYLLEAADGSRRAVSRFVKQ